MEEKVGCVAYLSCVFFLGISAFLDFILVI